jgi:hypothetical protein
LKQGLNATLVTKVTAFWTAAAAGHAERSYLPSASERWPASQTRELLSRVAMNHHTIIIVHFIQTFITSNEVSVTMAQSMPLMVWIVVIGNILWIAIYAILFSIIDFESDYMMSVDGVEGDTNA